MKPRRKVTSEERRILRRAKTLSGEKYGIGGRLKKKQPAPITLKNFEKGATQ